WVTTRERYDSLVLRAKLDGSSVSGRFSFVASPELAPGGFIASRFVPAGSAFAPGGDDGPTLSVAPRPSDPQAPFADGLVVARWDDAGALLNAGMLLCRRAASSWYLVPVATVPTADGGVLLVLHGSASVAAIPSVGEQVLLEHTGYERLVVLKARL